MATAQGVRAGKAFVELFADDSKLVRGLRAAEAKLKAFGKSVRNIGLGMAGVGSAILAPLAASAKLFGSYGDGVAKMAQRTGLSVEAMSELQYAAGLSGVEVSELENGLRRMQRTIFDAGRGLSTATDALKGLGLTAADLEALSPEDQFKLLAEQVSRIEDPTQRAATAMRVFGQSGTQLLPMFADGAKGIDALQAEARRLGLTMSAEDAKAAEDFSDALDRLWGIVKMGVFQIGAALAPTLKALVEKVTRVVVTVNTWIKQNRPLIDMVLKVAAAVVVAGGVLVALGTIISSTGTAIGVLVTIMTAAVAVFKAIGAAVMFLLSPLGLVTAGVATLGAYLIISAGAGGKALAWLGDRFNVLKSDALSAYQGISDAMAAGEMALAVKILWLTIKTEWTRGVNFLQKAWLGFKDFFMKVGNDAWYGALAGAEIVWHALETGWIETTSFLGDLWDGFAGLVIDSWESIKAAAQKAWNWIKGLFDDKFDVEAANQKIEQAKQQAMQKRAQKEISDKESREQLRADRRKQADDTHQGTMATIGQQSINANKELDTAFASKMAENEAALANARKEWQDAIDSAKQRREAKESGDSGPKDESADALKRLRDALAGLGDAADYIGASGPGSSSVGTFNAAALFGLGTGDAADRTAKATEQTAKNTKRLLGMDYGGSTFA